MTEVFETIPSKGFLWHERRGLVGFRWCGNVGWMEVGCDGSLRAKLFAGSVDVGNRRRPLHGFAEAAISFVSLAAWGLDAALTRVRTPLTASC